MARKDSEAAFDNLIQKNKDTFLKNRGSKSPYLQIEAPIGNYFGRITQCPRDVIDVEKKGADGKGTGFKEKTPRARLRLVIICADDPQCPSDQLEQWSGTSGFVDYRLPIGNDEAMQRYYGDLEQIGIDTTKLILNESQRTSDDQFTLADACTLIEESKPFCRLAITAGKTSGKFINYRGPIDQGDLEQLLGRSLDTVATDVEYEEVADQTAPFEADADQAPADEAPAEEAASEGGSDEDVILDEKHNLWHRLSDDTWYDTDGNQVENPDPPKKAPPKIAPPKIGTKPTVGPKATPAPVKGPVKPTLGKPGARPKK